MEYAQEFNVKIKTYEDQLVPLRQEYLKASPAMKQSISIKANKILRKIKALKKLKARKLPFTTGQNRLILKSLRGGFIYGNSLKQSYRSNQRL